MPRRSRAHKAKAQNAAQAREAYGQAIRKVQKVTIEEAMDENAPGHHHCNPNICTHNETPLEDPEIVEIINEFVHIQDSEDSVPGYDPELEDDEDEEDRDNPDPSIEIQELTDLEAFTQTLQKAHDAATATERDHQKGNKRPRRYLRNSKRSRCRHEANRKELEKKGFTSVIQWFSATEKQKSVPANCDSSQTELGYALDSSDEESDGKVRDFFQSKQTVDVSTGQDPWCR